MVHHAICAVIGPLLERRFIADSFACRVGKGAHRAVLRAQGFCLRFPYYLKADVRRFYDSVDHGVLLGMLEGLFREKTLRDLLRTIVTHPLPGQAPGRGLPIGNLTSQWFANLYLDRLDHLVKDRLGCPAYIRYMDDFVAWGGSKDDLFDIWREVRAFLAFTLRIELKDGACFVAPCWTGVPFLGMRIFPRRIRLQRPRLRRMRRLVRARERAYDRGEMSARELAESVGASFAGIRFLGLRPPVRSAMDA